MTSEASKAKARLKEYIAEDEFYNGSSKIESDFDKYCYEHCKDIETLLREMELANYEVNQMKKRLSLKNKTIEVQTKAIERLKEINKWAVFINYI